MSDLDDLIADATDGGLIEWSVTGAVQGREWRFEWPVADRIIGTSGKPIDFSAGSATARVYDGVTEKVTLDFAGRTDGTFVVTCPASRTTNLIGSYGGSRATAQYSWAVALSFGTRTLQLIRGGFVVRRQEAP